jgi:hypothetical protein
VLGRHYAIRPLTALEISGLVLLSVALSTASYRFIEQPARRANVRSRIALMWSAGAVMALFAAVGFGLAYADGLPGRYARELEVMSRATDSLKLQSGVCDGHRASNSDDLIACSMGGEPLGLPTFALWGDSHARVLAPAMATAAKASGRRGLLFTSSGCPPSHGELARIGSRTSHAFDCPAVASEAAGLIEQNANVRDVFLIARWAFYVEGTRYGTERGDAIRLSDRRSADGADGNAAIFERSLDALLTSLTSAQRRVWLLSQVPEVGADVPKALLRMAIIGRALALAPTRSDVLARQKRSLAMLERLAAKHRATLLRIDAPFCAGDPCRIVQDDGVPLYADDDHVSVDGAALIAPLLTEALRKP